MFGGDDDDFPAKGSKTIGGSKLSSLFAAEENLTSNPNLSLAYTAKKAKPTQPPPSASAAASTSPQTAASSAPPSATAVIHATLVNLLRYDSAGTAIPVGQRAVAILRTQSPSSPHPFHVLVAYEPTQAAQRQDCIASITDSFVITPSPPSYAAFHDDTRQYFACQLAPDQLDPLLRHVAMTRHAASLSSPPPLIVQDLLMGQGDRGVGSGDQVKVKYSMSLTSSSHPKGMGALVGHVGTDDKPKTIKVGGKKELTGIEQGLMGMKKGGRRFLVIPPHLGYGAHQAASIPPNSVLLVELSCIKVKFADGAATSPSPIPVPAAVPAASAPSHLPAATPPTSLPAPGGAPIPGGAGEDEVREDDSEHRHLMARKMSAMGYKMPGLPGATDPEHLAAARQAAGRRDSTDSRDGRLSEPPSPALSSVSAATTVPPVQPQTIAAPTVTPHPAPLAIPTQPSMPTPPPPLPAQQPQPPFYQQSPPTPYYPVQPQSSQPQHPPAGYNPTSFSAPHYGFTHDQAHYPSASSPSHHISPSHTPNQFGYAAHHHSASMSQLASFPSPHPSLPSSLLASIDSKLDGLLSSLSSHYRALGTSNPSLLYDAPITPAQLIRVLTSLLQERDDSRAKADTAERKAVEVTARLQALQESGERRWEGYAEEVRGKQALVVELQAALRKAESEGRDATRVKAELEGRQQILEEELTRARQEGVGRAEAERQVALLQTQLKQANEAMEGKQQEDRLAMTQRMAERDSEVARLQQEANTTRAHHQKEVDTLHQTINSLRSQLSQQQQEADTTVARLQASVSDSEGERTRLQVELDRLTSQHQVLQHNTVSAAEHNALQDRLRHLDREVQEARAQRESVMAEARNRVEQDRLQMVAAIERVRAEEFERGQQETLEEAKAGMAVMKERARATIDQLVREKEEAEERVRQAEDERDQLVQTSRAYIDKLKQQMAARLAQLEEERSKAEGEVGRAEEEKQAALKAVYSGVSRVLQQHGERRWKAHEVAMLVRAEVQFALTGERPEVRIEQEEKEPKEEEKEEETDQHKVEMVHRQEDSGETAPSPPQQNYDERLTPAEKIIPATPDVDVKEGGGAAAEGQRQEDAGQQPAKATTPNAGNESPPAPANVAVDAGPAPPQHGLNGAEPIDTTSAVAHDAEDTPAQTQHTTPVSPIADAAAPPTLRESQPSSTAEPSTRPEANSQDGMPTGPVSTSAVPSESDHDVDTTAEDGIVPQLAKNGTEAMEEEAEDELAPLPKRGPLSVDPASPPVDASSSSSSIAPPTPTIPTPPASSASSHSASAIPSSSHSTPRDAIADPFADPFADDVAATAPPPSSSSSSSGAKPAHVKHHSLFADDGDDDGGLFAAKASGAVKTGTARTLAVQNNSLFGDDDDDEGGLFK